MRNRCKVISSAVFKLFYTLPTTKIGEKYLEDQQLCQVLYNAINGLC